VNLPPITDDDRQFLSYNPNTDDIVVWVQQYALSARGELEQAAKRYAFLKEHMPHTNLCAVAWCWEEGRHDAVANDPDKALDAAIAAWEKARSLVDRPKNDTDFGHSTER
jgi:hypothetical protein